VSQPRVNMRSKQLDIKIDTDGCPRLQAIVTLLENSTAALSCIPEISGLLDEFQASSEINILLKRELDRFAESGSAVRPPSWNGFTLYQGEKYALLVERYMPSANGDFLATARAGTELRVLQRGGKVKFSLSRLPAGTDMTILDPHARLQHVQDIVLTADCPKASFSAGDVVATEIVTPTLMMTLLERSLAPFSWVFDRKSLTPLFVSAANQSLTRSRTLMELISAFHGTPFAAANAEDLLLQLGDHEFHFLRWSACQTLAKIKLSRARPLLARLAEDPHTHVQRAARAAIKRMNELNLAAQE